MPVVSGSGGMSGLSARAMMRVARNIVVPAMKRVAAVRTRSGAAAVNVSQTSAGIEVRAGTPSGRWGWTPIQASMFEDNRRHPLYGNRGQWYHQGHYPISSLTEKRVAKMVEIAYTDGVLPDILGKYGFK